MRPQRRPGAAAGSPASARDLELRHSRLYEASREGLDRHRVVARGQRGGAVLATGHMARLRHAGAGHAGHEDRGRLLHGRRHHVAGGRLGGLCRAHTAGVCRARRVDGARGVPRAGAHTKAESDAPRQHRAARRRGAATGWRRKARPRRVVRAFRNDFCRSQRSLSHLKEARVRPLVPLRNKWTTPARLRGPRVSD